MCLLWILQSALLGSLSAQVFAKSSKLPNGGEIKAVLVAGSNTYGNYRHQADVCHAYQILHENGIPDENIIVMMYDDIAYNEENPDQGVIINRPGGPNVYKGVPKDYTGRDVNKTNLFKILTGDEKGMVGIGSGRVLKSGPNDHVFINFVDHGGVGVLLMPSEEIKASELLSVLEQMSANKQFSKMFLYIEACESGSMFDNLLPDDLNIFVMTAADPHESSYACYFDSRLSTYLGDVFSVEWMQNSESVDLRKESVNHQFQWVRTETNTSHVEEYGDIDIGIMKLSEVIGYRENLSNYKIEIKDAVNARHVPIAVLGHRIKEAKSLEEKHVLEEQLSKLLKDRKVIEDVFVKLLSDVLVSNNIISLFQESTAKRPSLTKQNLACYENALDHFSEKCFSISQNPYAASHLHELVNLCNSVPETTIIDSVAAVCHDTPRLKGVN